MRTIARVEDFYAHALAIEREAAERYGEFAAHFVEHGEEALAALCRKLARQEREHYHELIRACEGLDIPAISPAEYRWVDGESPEAPAREMLYRIAQPHQLLEIALDAELRAREFFVSVARSSRSQGVKELAAIMAAEEVEHVRWVMQAIERHPKPPSWEELFEPGAGARATLAD